MPAHDFQPVAPEKGDSKSHELTMIQQFLILSQFHLVGLPCRHKRAFCSPVDIFWIVQIVSKHIIFRLFKVIFWLSTRVNHNQTTTIWEIFYFFSNHIKQIQVIMSRFRYPGSFFFAAFFEFISLNPFNFVWPISVYEMKSYSKVLRKTLVNIWNDVQTYFMWFTTCTYRVYRSKTPRKFSFRNYRAPCPNWAT